MKRFSKESVCERERIEDLSIPVVESLVFGAAYIICVIAASVGWNTV